MFAHRDLKLRLHRGTRRGGCPPPPQIHPNFPKRQNGRVHRDARRLISDARSPKRPPANNPAKNFSAAPSKLSFWINISATFLTVPASKSRVSWVQGCFSALAQTFNRVH